LESYTFTAEGQNYDDRFVLHFYGATGVDQPTAEFNEPQVYSFGQTVYVKFNELPKSNFQVEVFNVLGQQVYTKQLTPQNLSSIQLNETQGIYIVSLRTEKGMFSQKVAIK
jgi:hypothetical protein